MKMTRMLFIDAIKFEWSVSPPHSQNLEPIEPLEDTQMSVFRRFRKYSCKSEHIAINCTVGMVFAVRSPHKKVPQS
jgi:hypothetical protein